MKILTFKDKKILKDELLQNNVIAFPTETVFGLGVISTSIDAFNNLVKVKNRTPDKPFTLMCSSTKQISQYALVSKKSQRLIDKYMPGSITLLLPVKDNIPSYITLNSKCIGVRIPDSHGLIELIEYVGCPLLVPSANKSTFAPALTIDEVVKAFEGEIEYCVDGKTTTNIPSTIVMIDEYDKIKLIRKGPISFQEIEKEFNL